eukprot:scaffold52329_cov62-Phaeocystis_antarctica.AAC.1
MIAGLQQAAAPRASVRWLWASATMVAGLQHALQRLERLACSTRSGASSSRGCRQAPLRLQACSTQCTASSSWLGSALGLRSGLGGYRLALLWLHACSTRSGASSSRGYRYRRAPLRLQDFGCRPAARVAAPRAPGQCQGED